MLMKMYLPFYEYKKTALNVLQVYSSVFAFLKELQSHSWGQYCATLICNYSDEMIRVVGVAAGVGGVKAHPQKPVQRVFRR